MAKQLWSLKKPPARRRLGNGGSLMSVGRFELVTVIVELMGNLVSCSSFLWVTS